MLAKIWKKLLFFILVIACLFNIVNKFAGKLGFIDELKGATNVLAEKKVEEIQE